MASADLKVAVIDLSKVLDSYHKYKEAQAQLTENKEKAQMELNALVGEYEHKVQEAQKRFDSTLNPVLSPQALENTAAAYDQTRQDLLAMQKKIAATKADSEHALRDESGLVQKEVFDEISKAVEDYSGLQKFDLVVDKSGISDNGRVPLFVYSAGTLIDITNPIIEKLNATTNPIIEESNANHNPVIDKANVIPNPAVEKPIATAPPTVIAPVIAAPATTTTNSVTEKVPATAPPTVKAPEIAAPATTTTFPPSTSD
jgi:Skp family chaperone for outer membrane proteins